ncbi:MAG: DUF454 family protein [Pseudomonadales bacterium]|nr:DUF454 domain-containing protein [Pseudomonadales bacterium]NIX08809.1 DUF454 family protein [Pseudomonadales bacterium]
MRRKTTKLLFITGGWLSLALGIAGIPLPLLPTTPFLLLAAFCFAEGSDRLHDWLVNHVHFGPPIRRWREHRAISRRTKWVGSLSLVVILAVSIVFDAPVWLIWVQGCVVIVGAAFLWTFPEPPAEEE